MAYKELDVTKKIGADDVISYMHVGASCLALDSFRKAQAAFDTAFTHIVRSKDISLYQEALTRLLCDYSDLGELQKAERCIPLIKNNPLEDFDALSCISFAQYYESSNNYDSAAVYCRRILDNETDIYNKYAASKLLFCMYNKEGNIRNASHYAEIYMQLSDSIDFGKRQEMAATVNNEYQYHLDQRKEQKLKDEKEKYKIILTIVSSVTILLACASYAFYIRRKNRHLQEIVALSSELQRLSNDDEQLRGEIAKKEQELEASRRALEKSSDELDNMKQELLRVNAELSEYNEILKAKEHQLTEKMSQNKMFINMLHQSELEGKAEDVIYAVRQSSEGKRNMSSADWKHLYQAVDELYPHFKDRLLKELGSFSEQQMQVCYLMRIGLSKPQIQNMTGLSRVTVWRWVKKYDWVLVTGRDAEALS